MQPTRPTNEAADERIARALEAYDEVDAPAPTVSGGQVGANMTGGGQLSDPEVTDDPMGNPGGNGPKILHVPGKTSPEE
jgi:hypothetical protein